jgi:hypothetical protein
MMIFSIGRLENSIIIRPSIAVKSPVDGYVFDATNVSPFRKGMGNTIYRDVSVTGGVVCLFLCGGPLTVFRRVTKVVIDSVNTMRGARPLTHISKEVLKLEPAVADSNTSPTVVFKLGSIRIGTALDNIRPSKMFTCSLSKATTLTVSGVALFGSLSGVATTRLGMAGYKFLGIHKSFISALTNAVPSCCTAFSVFASAGNSEAVKSFSSKIDYTHNNFLYRLFCLGGSKLELTAPDYITHTQHRQLL